MNGASRLEGIAMPAEVGRLAERLRYSARVFVAPPWAEIHAQDAERKQSWDVAVATHAVMSRPTGRSATNSSICRKRAPRLALPSS
ncbi:MAG: hypothetical protein INR68_11135 [Methylobacterium mesophilicum]|nr:hypothetical protein [Methylobacterium mesophilicum]